MSAFCALSAATLVTGCAPAPAAEHWVSVIDEGAWTELDALDDPFRDHRPPRVRCGGVETSEGYLEVDTDICDWATVRTETLFDLPAGTRVRAIFYHEPLVADAPAEAHVAVLVVDAPLLDTHLAIPSDASSVAPELAVEGALPAGSPIYFHVHNHGANSYRLLAVEARLASAAR